jgi:hypothetical protein
MGEVSEHATDDEIQALIRSELQKQIAIRELELAEIDAALEGRRHYRN